MSDYCTARTDIEIDGEATTVDCSLRAGHPEAHGCHIWWHNDDPERAEQPDDEPHIVRVRE